MAETFDRIMFVTLPLGIKRNLYFLVMRTKAYMQLITIHLVNKINGFFLLIIVVTN